MVFALGTDDGELMVFPTAAEAVSYCEGIDVEDGGWLFFAGDGSPLEAQFERPNERGTFTVRSGTYALRPAIGSSHQPLQARFPEVRSVEGGGVSTVAEVERLLASGGGDRAGPGAAP